MIELLRKIREIIQTLPVQDVSAHIWWNHFHEWMLKQLPGTTYFQGDGVAFGEIGHYYKWIVLPGATPENNFEFAEVSRKEFYSGWLEQNGWIDIQKQAPVHKQNVYIVASESYQVFPSIFLQREVNDDKRVIGTFKLGSFFMNERTLQSSFGLEAREGNNSEVRYWKFHTFPEFLDVND